LKHLIFFFQLKEFAKKTANNLFSFKMLAADKLQLQSALKQQATALKEKEFSLHHNNLMTVGTQAAVLAGLDITMFIEFNPPDNHAWGMEPHQQVLARSLKMVYYGVIVAAFCANSTVVAHTTALSVLGGGLALRGPDGSMMTATDVLYAERRSVFYVFGIGLGCTIGSVLVCVWILLPWESALLCWMVTLVTCRRMYWNYQRVQHALQFDESQTVDFRDIFEGPANIRVTSSRNRYHNKNKAGGGPSQSSNKYMHHNSRNNKKGHDYDSSPEDNDPTTTDSEDIEGQQAPLTNNSGGANVYHQASKSRRRNQSNMSQNKFEMIQTV